MPRLVALLIAILAAPAAAATDAGVAPAGAFALADEARATADADRDGVADELEPTLCDWQMQGEESDGECDEERLDYAPPAGEAGDADADGVADGVEPLLCALPVPASVGTCAGDDFAPAPGQIVAARVRATGGAAGGGECAGPDAAPEAAACRSARVALDAGFGTYVLILASDEAAPGDATLDETTPGSPVGDRRVRACLHTALACALDTDADGRDLVQELFFCSDPSDPASRGPGTCWPVARAEALRAFACARASALGASCFP
ncbi:MAG TPA: hypothetical protein VM582_01820 [Candidatus Thermoplasmatota archaeon]|nr:hypothetical protein [Candidatus Thermoplasmatota archaeon]